MPARNRLFETQLAFSKAGVSSWWSCNSMFLKEFKIANSHLIFRVWSHYPGCPPCPPSFCVFRFSVLWSSSLFSGLRTKIMYVLARVSGNDPQGLSCTTIRLHLALQIDKLEGCVKKPIFVIYASVSNFLCQMLKWQILQSLVNRAGISLDVLPSSWACTINFNTHSRT